jgi:hypothetical protein
MLISKYFTIEEMILSQTATRLEINNSPNQEVIHSMELLCNNLLDKIREAIGKPVHVTSGFRCYRLNEAIGGAANSQHIKGEAADITVSGMTVENLFQFIKNSGFEFCQLIQEFDQWVHVSYSEGKNKKECMKAIKQYGKTVYLIIK